MFKTLYRTFSFSLKRLADYKGRSCREEYWYFLISSLVFYIPVVIIAVIIASVAGDVAGGWATEGYWVLVALGFLALQARRLHDIGYPAYWLALYFIPVLFWFIPATHDFISLKFMYTAMIGGFMAVCLWVKGVVGDNQYGEDPLKSSELKDEEG